MDRHNTHLELAQPIQDDEIDLGQLLIDIGKRWKTVVAITLVGTLLAVAIALAIPKEYRSSARIALPNDVDVERFNNEGLIKMNREELFKRYFQEIRSESNLRKYLGDHKVLETLYGESQTASNGQRLLADLISNYQVTVLEPSAPRGEIVEFPSLIEISLQHANEQKTSELLNNYVQDANDKLVSDFIQQFTQIKQQRLEQLNKQVALLRQAAKYQRERDIVKLEAQNSLKIVQLEQEKALLVELAKNNKQTQLAEVKEASQIANTLKIENPTPIDEFSASNREAATNIKLTSSQSLPLYLMGTRYLKALTETLSNRKDDAIFISKLNELDKQIQTVADDPLLAQLKARESDDAYIEELPMLMKELRELHAKSIDIANVQFYRLDKAATVTGKAVKPNRPLIVILGLMLSGMFALIVVLISASMARRNERFA
ncbi:hypothetical protein GCM10009092_17660 [Bowmanella denitrificans]|uniref:Polysaccharide chain length determinant N-terminal domain-containing protein n=1 Tax=Bowmanella denitrificans TaxID=366582 RepID=A0ABP3GUL4_9ALTE